MDKSCIPLPMWGSGTNLLDLPAVGADETDGLWEAMYLDRWILRPDTIRAWEGMLARMP